MILVYLTDASRRYKAQGGNYMKAKKISALLLAGAMSLSLLQGCGQSAGQEAGQETESGTDESSVEATAEDGSDEAEASESSDSQPEDTKESGGITFPLEEPVTLTMFNTVGDASEYTLEDSIFMQKMEERTNVHWEFIDVPVSELTEKKGVILNSGDYPDVFMKAALGAADYDSGCFIDLTDLIKEYAPNLSALLDKNNAWDVYKYSDGNLYATQLFQTPGRQASYMLINTVWLETLGREKPATVEEWYNVLKAFKEQDADGDGDPNNEIPFMLAGSDEYSASCIPNYFGINFNGCWGDYAVSDDKEKVFFWPASEEWKEVLTYLRAMYDEGILYNDCFNTSNEQMEALGQSGHAYGCFFLRNTGTIENVVGMDKAKEYDVLLPFDGYPVAGNDGMAGNTFAITDACEYPEIVMAWVDYLYTEEGSILARLGIEGETYKVDEDGMWSWITDGKYGADVSTAITVRQDSHGNAPGIVTDFETYSKYVDSEDYSASLKFEYDKYIFENDMLLPQFPRYVMTAEEAETQTLVRADIVPYWRQYLAQVVTGQLDLEESWRDYRQKMNDMELDRLEEAMNAAYGRYKQQ